MAALTVWKLLLCSVLTGSQAQDCGVASLNTKIVGGENASAGSWPWQVSVHYNGAHICGGTLISDQWVLTAAHCIILNSLSAWTLYFGKVTQSGPNIHEVNRTVSQVIVNPDFNNPLFSNDIALMKLSSPVNYTVYIRPICLASSSSQFYTSTPCWVTGWGLLGYDQPVRAYDILQQVQIPVVGSKQCSCDYSPVTEANITNEMICAGELNKGTCQGDSGGPLQCRQGSVWIQAGITSFGVLCSMAGFPGVYTRVSQFETWITNQVAGSNVNFATFTSSGTNQDSSFVCHSVSESVTTAAPGQTQTQIQTQAQTQAQTHAQTQTHTQAQTQTQTHAQTHTHAQAQPQPQTHTQAQAQTQAQTQTSTASTAAPEFALFLILVTVFL